MLKSQTVEDALVRRFDLVKVYHVGRISDAERSLEAASSIGTSKEGLISIAVEDLNKQLAASIANGYVEELKNLMQRVAVTEAGQRRVFFEQQVEAAKKSLAQAEQALRATQEKTGVIQLDGQAKAIIESVVTLRARMAAKQVQVDAMKAFATDQNPDLILANQELAGMRRQLSKMESQQSTSGDSVAIPTGNVPESGLEYVRRLRKVAQAPTSKQKAQKAVSLMTSTRSRSAALNKRAGERNATTLRLSNLVAAELIGHSDPGTAGRVHRVTEHHP
jgi:capsule polysaccharide export protein KpsE/RkpR